MTSKKKIADSGLQKEKADIFPTFGGSTGGWLRSAETEEKYVLIWDNNYSLRSIFEMPTGGSAIMQLGRNVTYFAKKEQCLALGKQLRASFKIPEYKIARIFPNLEMQFLHPKDGTFPEKVSDGRIGRGINNFAIGKEPGKKT